MFCGECGAQNPDTNQFCRNCGKPLRQRQPAAPQTTPQTVPQTAPPAPAPAGYVPAPGPAAPVANAPVPGTSPKRAINWLGIVSLVLAIVSWGVLTVILAFAAILLGIVSIVLSWKATGRIGILSVLGIVIGIAAIVASAVLA